MESEKPILTIFIQHVQKAKIYLDVPDMGGRNFGRAKEELKKAHKLIPLIIKGE